MNTEAWVTLPIAFAALLWLVGSRLAAWGTIAAIAWIDRFESARRSWWLLVVALYPAAAAIVITLMVFVSPLSAVVIDYHCHGGICGHHVPALEVSSSTAWLLAVLFATAGGVLATHVGLALWRSVRLTRAITALARESGSGDFRILDSSLVLACCVGVVRPSVIMSRGLTERANPTQMKVVLLHELAHARRLDNLRTLVTNLATLTWPAATRERLLRALHDAAEESCDQQVLRRLGDHRVVEETLEAVRRWRHDGTPLDTTAPAPELRRRIAALRQPPDDHHRSAGFVALLAVATLVPVALLAGYLHHVIETLIGFI